MNGLSRKSAWPAAQVAEYLTGYIAPLRLAVSTEAGFPLLCSLWFRYDGERLLCATHEDAAIARHLRRDGSCAFELAPNDPPYFGVRGRGVATVESQGAAALLGDLIVRYLGPSESELSRWLLSRSEHEVCLAIEPAWLTSWDYRDRMTANESVV